VLNSSTASPGTISCIEEYQILITYILQYCYCEHTKIFNPAKMLNRSIHLCNCW
jgi:hypothetical protein